MSDNWDYLQSVYDYLKSSRYPDKATKDEKRRIREQSKSFAVKEEQLLHRGSHGRFQRVIVDPAERDKVISNLHGQPLGGSHYGQNATLQKVTDRFWWKSVTDDTKEFVRGCAACQKANPSNKPPPSSLNPIPVKGLFHRWGVDLVGPLKETKNGNKYVIVATEYLSRWPEAFAIPDKSAESVHKFLLDLVYRFGSCHVLLHDQGREFNNATVNGLCEALSISVAMTTAYHPQTNG